MRAPDANPVPAQPLVQVENLRRFFDVSGGWLRRTVYRTGHVLVRAVNDVSFAIQPGETFSLVGESGSGKSTVGRLIVGLDRPTDGRVLFEGQRMDTLGRAEALPLRRRMQMIFQDPYASLNPRWRVNRLVSEPVGHRMGREERFALAGQLLEQVGLSRSDLDKFPHEFSGGQRQRICIARALASNPEFLVCDEPTSALDVSVQAQILNLMLELQRELGLTYLFISHNLAVVYHVSTRVGVLYLGALCEVGMREQVFGRPRHPYTRMLLDSVPDLELSGKPRTPVAGEVPSPINPPPGCTFHPRCPFANERCKRELPQLHPYGDGTLVACHAVEEGRL
ncbi:MAG TPA: oligopeptide/dipeptide ABC transporter ATP-binding protein [bacterium]|nr:oligopeptide/dipeptide ABC transporter ATP-binding protein [bacterium]